MSDSPARRKRRYPPSIERGRAAVVAASALMALVGCALLDELTGPQAGLGLQMVSDFHRWFESVRGARLGLTARQMLWVVTSLHLLTAAFLLALDLLGGRSAYLAAFQVAAPVVFLWGTGAAALLGAYQHFALCAGLGAGAGLCVIFVSAGIVTGVGIRSEGERSEAAAEPEPDPEPLDPGESEPELDPAASDPELDRAD